MSFGDTVAVSDLKLGHDIKIYAEHGEVIPGRVVQLAFLGDDETEVGITLRTEKGWLLEFNRKPSDSVTVD